MAAKKNKIESVGFQLIQIITDQFAIIRDSYDKLNDKTTLTINLNFGRNKEHHFIASSALVQFEQGGKPFLITEVTDHFEIEEQAWESFITKDNKFIIPQGFASHLVVLTIGTLRGVLHAKTENTEFNKFVLPTVNVTELIKGDVYLDV